MVEPLGLEEAQSPLLSLLQQIVFEDNFLRKIKAVDILISALDDDIKTATNAMQMKKYLHQEVLSNDEFRRKVELFARVCDNVETGIEYFGQDFITHPEFNYSPEFMGKLSQIEKKVHHFVGKLIKEYSAGEEIQFA